MLARMIRRIFGGAGGSAPPQDVYPNEMRHWLAHAHAGAPLDRHLAIALGDLRIGAHDLRALTDRCLEESDSATQPLKALHRPLASYFLARYFLEAMERGGRFAECGVFRGTSALILCRAARTRRADYAGEGLHLIDSFEGLGPSSMQDAIDARHENGSVMQAHVPAGSLAAPATIARKALRDFPAAAIHQGWIPGVFAALPDSRWSFVHIDVDLYEPTRNCLEYFFPRLSAGGVIVCDDYGAPMFPGAHRAWNEFCRQNDVPFVVLDTGQSVILKA